MAVALIVAAGRGERLGSGRPKALVSLCGRPMLEWSVASLRAVPAVTTVVVALPADELGSAPEGTIAVAGGLQRSHSVRAALAACADGDPVIVHDAARPLAAPQLFEQALAPVAHKQPAKVAAQLPSAIHGAAHPPSAMSTAARMPLAQVYNEMHGLIVGVGKNYCRKTKAACEECPLRPFLPAP